MKMPCFDQRLLLQHEQAAWRTYETAKDRKLPDSELQRLYDAAAAISTKLREHIQVCTECRNAPPLENKPE